MRNAVAVPELLRWDSPQQLSYSADDISAAGALVGLRQLKTRVVVDDADKEHDPYLRSLLAQALGVVTSLTQWVMRPGTFGVHSVYSVDEVLRNDRYIALQGPVDRMSDLTLVDSDDTVIRVLSWDTAFVHGYLGATGVLRLAEDDVDRREEYIRTRHSTSWDQWLGANPAQTPLAEIVNRVAGTLYSYRESQTMGFRRARDVVSEALTSPSQVRL